MSCFIHGWPSSHTYATRWSAWARARYSLSIFSTRPYNPAGDLTQKKTPSGTSSYSYDSQGNLRQVTLEDGRRIDYAIDPDNRRTGKRTNGQLQWQLVWQDQLRPIARLKADHTLEATYYYADKPNVPEAMQKNGKTYRIVSDPLGSVRLVIDSETGDVAQQLDYDAWGRVTLDTNPGFQPFGFAGGLYDPDTGLTRFGARDYDGETGRWTAKDPILFEGGDSNLFGYVNGDPVNFSDSLGLQRGGTSSPYGRPVYIPGTREISRSGGALPSGPPSMAENDGYPSGRSILQQFTNMPNPSKPLPGEYVGINFPWSMPNLGRVCARWEGIPMSSPNEGNICRPGSSGPEMRPMQCVEWQLVEIKQ